jgi:ubiquinol-cytochrome c reductase cytochrome c1 subunit
MRSAAARLATLLTCVLLAFPLAVLASESVELDRLPADVSPGDPASLQRGVQVFVNYCMSCHSANYMRYNRLADLGLTDGQILDNLVFTGAKVGELMKTAMDARDAREWFGAPPPDLTVIARSRSSSAGSGADWLYSYLRSFYRDPSRPSGWNNTVFPNVGMPHVLWQLQGEQVLKTEVQAMPVGNKGDVEKREVQKLVLGKPGAMKPAEYDRMVADLVNYLSYMSEPARSTRVQLGIYVLLFLGVLLVLSYLVKNEYWKDIH